MSASSKSVWVVLAVLVIAGAGLVAAIQHQSRVQLGQENSSLRRQLSELPRVTADNQRLSNIVAQAKTTLAGADERFQELLRLRAEVTRLTQENQSNRVAQAKAAPTATDPSLRELSALRAEISGLRSDISKLREELQPGPAVAASPPAAERPVVPAAPLTRDEQPLAIRTIETHGETFAEKLKRSVSARDDETFQEVFGRFLQLNAIDLSNIAGLGFDERTGRIFIRAPQTTLDQIEKLTLSLDRAP